MPETFSTFLKQLRVSKGVPVSQLAQRAGISRATLHRWEAGGRLPCLPELEAALKALNASTVEKNNAIALLKAPRAVQRLRQETPQDAAFWEKAGNAPHGGDLLRAMRQRKGWTQAQTAQTIGALRSTLARWERSETWPEADQLHALCYALEAREEEIVALTTGRFSLADGKRSPSQDDIRRGLDHLTSWPCPPEKVALDELNLLTFAAQTWPLARQQRLAKLLLAEIYTVYADRLFLQRRFAESEQISNRALDIYNHLHSGSHHIALAAIRSAEAATLCNDRHGVDHARETLRLQLPNVCTPRFRSWMLSELGLLEGRRRRAEEAYTLGREAIGIAQVCDNAMDRTFRAVDMGRIYLHMGQAHQALALAPEEVSHPHVQFTRVQAHLALGDRCAAYEGLQCAKAHIRSERAIAAFGTPYYSGIAASLEDQIEVQAA